MKARLSILVILSGLLLAACGESGNNPEKTEPPNEVNQQAPILANTLSPTELVEITSDTPQPLSVNLASGDSRQIATATDVFYQPTPRNRIEFESHPVNLSFTEFFDGFNIRTGLILSDKLVSLDGVEVVIQGYVAPPLKPELDYLVLTMRPMSTCPFCTPGGDYPSEIALVYLDEEQVISIPYQIRVTGRLEVGNSLDAETGFVSVVRLYAENVEILSN